MLAVEPPNLKIKMILLQPMTWSQNARPISKDLNVKNFPVEDAPLNP